MVAAVNVYRKYIFANLVNDIPRIVVGTRFFWQCLGLLAVGCGLAGIVLPLVPTTPFLLVAAYAFSRSSPALHDWLLSHPHCGPLIRNWRDHGAIPRRAKWMALCLMMGALAISVAMALKLWVIILQAVVLICVGIFIMTRPDAPRVD